MQGKITMEDKPAVTPRPGVGRAFDVMMCRASCAQFVDKPDAWAEQAPTRSRLAIAPAVLLALAVSGQALAGTCDDFKAKLAARIESAGVRGYSIETVSAKTAVPSDAKVIGTCESGARKILYRRWGAARASSAEKTTSAASALQPPAVPDMPTRQAPTLQEERTPSAPPESRSNEAAPAVVATAPEPAKAPTHNASAVAATPPISDTVVKLPAPVKTETRPDAPALLARRASDIVASHWPWIGALLLLAQLGWLWRTHFSAYDKDGLPRGPRL
jgi:hypothetical protein